MKNHRYFKSSASGTIIAAVCCFTPFLVVLLGFAGLSAWLGWLDYVLFPIMYASMGLMAYSFYLHFGKPGANPKTIIVAIVIALSALLFWLEFKFGLRLSIAAGLGVAAYAYFLRRRAV